MAFQFPDPSVATTVVNQDTGITYQWQDPPGKWVIAVEDLDTYCVVQQTSTLETNVDGQVEFYTDFEITGDKILTTTVNETVDYIVSYEGVEERVTNLSDVEKQKIGFVEIRKDKYISQSAPDASLVGGVTLKQVITMFDIGGVEFECISAERILFGPTGALGPQGTVSQPLECCHKFIAAPRTGSAYVIISEDPPEKNLVEGLLWFSSKDTEYNLFVYCEHEDIWVPASPNVGESIGDIYVKKAGDTMTGDLDMRSADINFYRTGEADVNGDWDPADERFAHIESRPPQLIQDDGTSAADTSEPFGIRVEIDDGNTYKNQFKVGNRNGDVVTIQGGTGPNVIFGDFARKDAAQHGIDNGVVIKGIPTPDKDVTPGSFAANKEYVDQREAYLQNEIVELAEEIEALAPSVERGEWEMTLSGGSLNSGHITFYDGTFGNGSPIGIFKQVQSVWFSSTDSAGVPHGFDNVDPGHLLELFVQGENDYGLFEVVEVHDQTVGSPNPYYAIDVNFVRALNDTSKADPGDMVRMKTFQAPSGGNAGDFVKRTGDKMTGELNLHTIQPSAGVNYSTPPSQEKDIRFTTRRADSGQVITAQLFQPGYSTNIVSSGHFMSKGSLYTSDEIRAFSLADGGTTFNRFSPTIKIESTGGYLHYNDARRLAWHTNGGTLTHGTASSPTNIFGWTATHSLAYKPIQFTDTSTNTSADHAIHKGYVDIRFDFSTYTELS